MKLPAALLSGVLGLAGAAGSGSGDENGAGARALYLQHCSGCHLANGAGNPAGGIPDLRTDLGSLASFEEGRVYLLSIPGVAENRLSDREVAGVLNWAVVTFASRALPPELRPFTEEEVFERRRHRIRSALGSRPGLPVR